MDMWDICMQDDKPAELPPVPQEQLRCDVFLPLKKRYCRCFAVAGSTKCGSHKHLQEESGVEGSAADPDSGLRVPCPLDPNHTVLRARLEQHVRVCSKLRDANAIEQQPFYVHGINLRKDSMKECEGHLSSLADDELLERIKLAYKRAVSEVLCRQGAVEKSARTRASLSASTSPSGLHKPENFVQ
eukprot:1663443-Amphidinium_carterae.1